MDTELDSNDFASPERFNYFNYFTEVEDEFVRRRGKHLLVSPIDWALVESWKDAGIPLTVVIRGISRAFDAFEARPKHFRNINSILYCQQAVEETYAEYQLARVGGDLAEPIGEEEAGKKPSRRKLPQTSSFTSDALGEFIQQCEAQLADAARLLTEGDHTGSFQAPAASPNEAAWAIDRARSRLAEIGETVASTLAIDAEGIEADLCALDNMLFEQLKMAYGAEQMQLLRSEAQTQLKGYKSKMDKAMYELTLDNFVGRRLRGMCRVPRLSLFYM